MRQRRFGTADMLTKKEQEAALHVLESNAELREDVEAVTGVKLDEANLQQRIRALQAYEVRGHVIPWPDSRSARPATGTVVAMTDEGIRDRLADIGVDTSTASQREVVDGVLALRKADRIVREIRAQGSSS